MKDWNPATASLKRGGAMVLSGKGEVVLYQTEDGRSRAKRRFQEEMIYEII